MKDVQKLLAEIGEVTTRIETDYPELYRFLDENPITLPSEPDFHIGPSTLREYLLRLKEMLHHHLETHKNNV